MYSVFTGKTKFKILLNLHRNKNVSMKTKFKILLNLHRNKNVPVNCRVHLTLYGVSENKEKGVTRLVQLLAVTLTPPVGSTLWRLPQDCPETGQYGQKVVTAA
jgi:hypothetical protein